MLRAKAGAKRARMILHFYKMTLRSLQVGRDVPGCKGIVRLLNPLALLEASELENLISKGRAHSKLELKLFFRFTFAQGCVVGTEVTTPLF